MEGHTQLGKTKSKQKRKLFNKLNTFSHSIETTLDSPAQYNFAILSTLDLDIFYIQRDRQ